MLVWFEFLVIVMTVFVNEVRAGGYVDMSGWTGERDIYVHRPSCLKASGPCTLQHTFQAKLLVD